MKTFILLDTKVFEAACFYLFKKVGKIAEMGLKSGVVTAGGKVVHIAEENITKMFAPPPPTSQTQTQGPPPGDNKKGVKA